MAMPIATARCMKLPHEKSKLAIVIYLIYPR
jgi:hypothetical protein